MTWQFARKPTKVFVYRNGAANPSFTFTKHATRDVLTGYGHQFSSFERLVKFIEQNGDTLLKTASAPPLVANRTH